MAKATPKIKEGETLETSIELFDGGITSKSREPAENSARMITNLDVITDAKKMTPYRDSVSGDNAANTSQKQNFCVALRTGTTYSLYSLGVKSGTAFAEVLYKNLLTGGLNDFSDSGWANTANNQSVSGAVNFNFFIYYKRVGLIFGAKAGVIWAYDPSGVAAFLEGGTGNSINLSFTNIAQGLVHSQDDNLYLPYDNKIAVNNAGVWTAGVATISAEFFITSICEYGNFLAIAAAPLSGVGKSRVYLWNRDTSVNTFSESIDWGEGKITILEDVDGVLIGVSQAGGFGGGNTAIRNKDRIIIRYYAGGGRAEKLKEFIADDTNSLLPIAKQKIDNRLYFMMRILLNGAVREGVWSIGRSSPSSPFVLVHERTPNNNTALVASFNLFSFIYIGDYLFISYMTNSAYAVSKTNSSASYTATSIYESKIFNGDNASFYKQLMEATVKTEYLPAAGQIVLKYRVDQNTSWTTIFTNITANSISHTAVNIETSGAALPNFYKEIQFRLESTGGAEITGFSFKEKILGKKFIAA